MIALRNSIKIRTMPQKLFKWLEAMPEEYCSRHPDHIACRVLKGSLFHYGSEIECQEILHGKLHSMRFHLTKFDPDRRLEYGIQGMGNGAFEAVPKGEKVEFIAELDLGTDTPIIGLLVDVLFRILFRSRLGMMRQHMLEEGQNLKQILEA